MAGDNQKSNDRENMPKYMQRQYGKSASLLEASSEVMSDVRKAIIRYALDLPIRDIRTYSGYKGDLLVEITTGVDEILPKIKAHAESLGMETVVKERYDVRIHQIYCIVPDEDVYDLK